MMDKGILRLVMSSDMAGGLYRARHPDGLAGLLFSVMSGQLWPS